MARQARDEDQVGRSISDWSVEQFGDELAQAFEEFLPENPPIGERDFALLLTWFISDRELSAGRGTPIERYLARADLDQGEREVARRIAAAHLGLYRVRVVEPGRSLKLESVLAGGVISVASQTVSRAVVRWDVVLCRVMPGEPAATLWGPVLVYAPDEEPELHAELERLADLHGRPRPPTGLSEVFRLASGELLRFVPPSRLAERSYFTAEGDPVVAARSRWSLVDPDDAFRVLDAPPELLWVGESEDGTGECFQLTGNRAELLARRPPPPPNALFFESSYEGFPDRIGIGTFVLAGSELRFDAISEPRLENAIELVSDRLVGNAQLVEREVAPLDLDRTERAEALAPAETDVLASDYLEQYLRRWLDEPLARLEGLSRGPRLPSRSCMASSSFWCVRSRTEPGTPAARARPGRTSVGFGTSSALPHHSPRSANLGHRCPWVVSADSGQHLAEGVDSKGVTLMVQQGQVSPLTSHGETRWAYRYRTGGRGARRVQRGGFATEQAAVEALERLRRERGLIETPTLAEFVDAWGARTRSSCCEGLVFVDDAAEQAASDDLRRAHGAGGRRSSERWGRWPLEWLCQRSRVSGRTRNAFQLRCGITRLSAASNSRSCGSYRG